MARVARGRTDCVDVVLVDGRARGDCALELLPYLRPDSLVFVHDWTPSRMGGTEQYDKALEYYDVLDKVSHPRAPPCTDWTRLVPPSRTDWTRLVPPPVLSGHVQQVESTPALQAQDGKGAAAYLPSRKGGTLARAPTARNGEGGGGLHTVAPTHVPTVHSPSPTARNGEGGRRTNPTRLVPTGKGVQ